MIRFIFSAVAFLLAVTTASAQVPDLPTDFAVIGWLDKVTARVNEVEVAVGQPVQIGTLELVVRSCFTRPPELPSENAAFFDIRQSQDGTQWQEVFRGWMFSSSPAVSAMDHPVYDVWLLDCSNNTASSES